MTTVGQIVVQALRAKWILDCPKHEWIKLNDTEDQCRKCGVIATEEGKRNLKKLKK